MDLLKMPTKPPPVPSSAPSEEGGKIFRVAKEFIEEGGKLFRKENFEDAMKERNSLRSLTTTTT